MFIFLKWYIQRYCWVFKRDLSSKSFEMEGFFSGWERRKKSLFTHESRIIYGPGKRNVVRNRKKNCLPFSVYMANASIKSWYTVVLMHHHFDGFCDFKQMLGIRAKKKENESIIVCIAKWYNSAGNANECADFNWICIGCVLFFFLFFSLDELDLFLSALYSSVFTFHCNQTINTRIYTQKIC